MPRAPRRTGPSPDPIRQQLIDVRRGLLRLHKALIDAERRHFESRTGALSNGQFLQALINDPYLQWLRPFSGLIVEIDEALADSAGLSSAQVRSYLEQVRRLVEPPEGSDAAEHYAVLRDRDIDVLVAHVELTSRMAIALED